jgi:hypothetical protein
MASADRGAPERLAPHRADDAADHGSRRPGNDQARSGASHRANLSARAADVAAAPASIAAIRKTLRMMFLFFRIAAPGAAPPA